MSALTPKQVELIQNSWEPLKKDPRQNGVDLFVALFKAYPAYQQLFSQFKDLTIEEVAKSSKMRAHGSTVMHSLSSIVDSLDDEGCVVEILRKRTQSHWPRGVRLEQYQNLFKLFPVYLKSKLGDQLDEETGAAWGAAVGVMMSVIEDELKQLSQA